MRGWIILLLALALVPGTARAQPPVVVSAGPQSVAVTIYRDNERGKGQTIRFDRNGAAPLGGFALIDEVRDVDLPPGAVTVRFEGVASGIVPQSALLFDTDLAEKNFDSRLLSERGLIDAFTGQRVTIRRTHAGTGEQTLEQGTIVSRPDGLILQTAGGYEAIRCEGGFTTLLYPGKPVDLTARPTLSLTTRADQTGGRVRLRLVYLAANFDWQANYVGTFAPDGASLDLMAWMTVASHDRTSFPDAELSAIAGRVFRALSQAQERTAQMEARRRDPYSPGNIVLAANCWPQDTTSIDPLPPPAEMMLMDLALPAPAPPPPPSVMARASAARIVQRTDVGDLKLYTVPQLTTLAPRSMKQVRFLDTRTVQGEALYRARYADEALFDEKRLFRFRNDKAAGLGEPLPMGKMTLFQETRLGRQLLGEASIEDKAQDEQVEIELPETPERMIDAEETWLRDEKDGTRRRVTVTNDHVFPILAEIAFADTETHRLSTFSQSLVTRDGRKIWRVAVPARSARAIIFRSRNTPAPGRK